MSEDIEELLDTIFDEGMEASASFEWGQSSDPARKRGNEAKAKVRAEIEQLRARAEQSERERDAALDERDGYKAVAKRLSMDGLCALSAAGICTPEKGFLNEPAELGHCIHQLRKERDVAVEALKLVEPFVTAQAEALEPVYDIDGLLTAGDAEEYPQWAHIASQVKRALAASPTPPAEEQR